MSSNPSTHDASPGGPPRFGDAPVVTLRAATRADLPALHAFESDPAWCALAMVKPRSPAAFEAVWARLFADWAAGKTDTVQKAILADGELCGTIGCRPVDGQHEVGYGLSRAAWGRGIATRALGLLLAEVPIRPVYATVAASNAASIRVLTKHGFAITERRFSPETERYLACDEVRLVLE